MPKPTGLRRVVLLAVPPVQSLDVMGPAEVFAAANQFAGGPHYAVELATAGPSLSVATDSGVALLAHCPYRQLRGPIDTFLVAGGAGARLCRDLALARWLAREAPKSRRYGSICTGAYLLGLAGLLKGRRVTTHWAWADGLSKAYPDARVDSHPLWIQDDRLYTSAGVTAGIDLSLSLVEEDLGSTVAQTIARHLVLFLRRSGGQTQYSMTLAAQAAQGAGLRDLPAWLLSHLKDDLRVERIAAQAAMSPRHFSRVFAENFGAGPAHYVERLRLEAARRELELSSKSLAQVAGDCGFGSAEVLRRSFQRVYRTSPARHREHFKARQT